MRFQTVTATLATIAVMTTMQGCTTLADNSAHSNSLATTGIPAADPQLDHYIAWVPRNQAQTATVAEAMTHISLVNAREQTAKQLCGSDRITNGEVTESFGPIPTTAPDQAGGYPAWYYRISLRPGPHGCQSTSSLELYHMLQEHLPEWIDVRAANTSTLSLIE